MEILEVIYIQPLPFSSRSKWNYITTYYQWMFLKALPLNWMTCSSFEVFVVLGAAQGAIGREVSGYGVLALSTLKKSKPPRLFLCENALMFSISQRVVDFWLFFTILFSLKKTNVGVSCGMLKPAELLTCAPALAFTANSFPVICYLLVIKGWCYVIQNVN